MTQPSKSDSARSTSAKKLIQKLSQILDNHKGERHVIVIQDFPDPDAISAAYAHQLISTAYDIEADIVYSGSISHQQNLALVNLLGISLLHFDRSMDMSVYSGAVFVDHQGTTARQLTKALEKAGVPILIVLDHHEPQSTPNAEFCDIRSIGATATMYAQYLEQGILELDSGAEEHMKMATALMHGVITDTNNFMRAGPEDFYAAAFLSRYRDADILEQIMNQARSKKTMEIIQKALEERVIAESVSIAGIGYLRSDDRDAIPQAADFLVTEENVHTAIVYGLVQGADQQESIIGSLRTSKLTLDPDNFLKGALGHDASGSPYGGGKHSAGGFQIPVDFLAQGKGEEYRQVKWKAFDAQIKQKIFDKIGFDSSAKTQE
ncbi:DHH family phosphoesterase [Desulfovermiculus halophilus]|jgi:nanoRNase/pAp phosphatase (c-di-AMP/oligoRNAs hydrolase)|uniref:DHH family phosphoesterase n=1 Tax=Desulfovermiculus halophilus TaxID=339722 RepID=UPI000684FAC7|nr:bifunctional oligoribonuclease/PAP phosphatase NrnA [Desulfovermiculus halophilus]